jgi:hypothetical protein
VIGAAGPRRSRAAAVCASGTKYECALFCFLGVNSISSAEVFGLGLVKLSVVEQRDPRARYGHDNFHVRGRVYIPILR